MAANPAPSAAVIQAAFDAGYDARVQGQSARTCPYNSKVERLQVHAWINGWVSGAEEAADAGAVEQSATAQP